MFSFKIVIDVVLIEQATVFIKPQLDAVDLITSLYVIATEILFLYIRENTGRIPSHRQKEQRNNKGATKF